MSPDDDQLRRFAAERRRWYADPNRFNTVALNRSPYWGRQVEVCESVCKYRTTVVYSGNAIGKDYLVGGLVPWWLYTRVDSLVICTGPSQTILGSVLWKEVRRALESSHLQAPRLSTGIKASPALVEISPGWQALGYSTTSVERASGQHANQLLVVVEEASGVEEEIWDALDSLKYTRLLAIGNPIRADGRFVEMIRQAKADQLDQIPKHLAVNAIQIPSTDSPHATLDHSPFGLADKTWLDAMARRYGVDSLWYRSHVKAEIPELSADTLIPEQWIDRAVAAVRAPLQPFDALSKTRRIACDLSEGVGRDSTAIVVRDDDGILEWVAGSTLAIPEAAQRIAELARRWRVEHHRISYDSLGIGRDLKHHLIRCGITAAVPYAGSGRPRDRSRFTNLRTEAAWRLRDRLNPDRSKDPRWPLATQPPAFAIPADANLPMLREEIQALTYECVGNQVRLVPKDDLCAQLGRSPDRCDALLQSFAFD